MAAISTDSESPPQSSSPRYWVFLGSLPITSQPITSQPITSQLRLLKTLAKYIDISLAKSWRHFKTLIKVQHTVHSGATLVKVCGMLWEHEDPKRRLKSAGIFPPPDSENLQDIIKRQARKLKLIGVDDEVPVDLEWNPLGNKIEAGEWVRNCISIKNSNMLSSYSSRGLEQFVILILVSFINKVKIPSLTFNIGRQPELQ